MEIEWEDPPFKHAGRYSVDPRQIAMKENPGRWMVWGRGFANSSYTQSLKKQGFEAKSSRDKETHTFTIYARWPADGD